MTDPFTSVLDSCGVSGWLREFVDHTANTESPSSFRFFTGLTVVASLLRRRVYLPMGPFTIYPPTQVMLAGPAGASKKSTTAKYGISMTDHMYANAPHMLMNNGSPEALWKQLSRLTQTDKQACGLLFVSELATFMGKQEYSQTLAQMLTDLFDSPDHAERETIGGGKQRLENVGISALFCSNETWLSQAIPATAIQGGLPSRMLIIYEKGRAQRVAWPGDHMGDDHERERLAGQLDQLNFKHGPVDVTPAAKAHVEDWYTNLPDAPMPEMEPFYARLQIHLLRLAMVLAAQQDLVNNNVQIDLPHIKQADAVLNYIIARLPELYRFLAMGRFGSEYERAVRLIGEAGGEIDRRVLGKKMANTLSRNNVNEILETLVTNGEVELVRRGRDYFCRLRNR